MFQNAMADRITHLALGMLLRPRLRAIWIEIQPWIMYATKVIAEEV